MIIEYLLDFVIRNQILLLTAIAIVFVLLPLGMAAPSRESSTTRWCEALLERPNLKVKYRLVARVALGLGVMVIIGVAFIWVHDNKPIPPTAFLKLPDTVKKNAGNTKLILLLHGWNGDSQETWRHFPELLAKDDRLGNVDILPINYPTYFGRRNLNITELAGWIVREIHSRGIVGTYGKIAIIAHSMGGLVGREIVLLERLRGSDKPYGVLVEIASPHNGADVASLADAIGLSQPLTEELRAGSSFLATLNTQWASTPGLPSTHCYTSKLDKIVSSDSASFLCDRFYLQPQWGHTDLVKPNDHNDPRYSHPASHLVEFMDGKSVNH